MNVVLILTDTHNRHHCGAYGFENWATPNLDRLAREGLRYDRAYCNSPPCTPARGVMFTGLHASANGTTYNDATPYRHVPLLGTLLRQRGARAGYTGKWHLDGMFYHGAGVPDGGFEPDWWYDGTCYQKDVGDETFWRWKKHSRLDWQGMLDNAFRAEDIWGYRVADRAVDFLESVGSDEPFFLCASFDEPHGPFMAPREIYEQIGPLAEKLPMRTNLNASLENKPFAQQWHAVNHSTTVEDVHAYLRYYLSCIRFMDDQAGRIIEAVDRLHGEDTVILYTSDHGEMMGSHGQWGKGSMMYEETMNVPLIARGPGISAGTSSNCLTGHVDLLPTIMDLMELDPPEILHGRSLRPTFADPSAPLHDMQMICYERFGNGLRPIDDERKSSPYQPGFNDFYPVRSAVTDRYKLVLNLLDSDELYDLDNDPYEMTNLIDDPAHAAARDAIHRELLETMKRTDDPQLCLQYVRRPWNDIPLPETKPQPGP